MNNSQHSWRFFRSGGVAQVRIDSGSDIRALADLDQKLWMALSCPTKGLYFPGRALEVLDRDGDGKIRAPEILDWIAWLQEVLVDLDVLTQRSATLPLAAIRNDTEEGRRILSAAKLAQSHLGGEAALEIRMDQISQARERVSMARENGDGVVPIAVIDDPELRKTAELISKVIGTTTGSDKREGISNSEIDAFLKEAEVYISWLNKGNDGAGHVAPFGAGTRDAYRAFTGVRAKIDDYFMRRRFSSFYGDADRLLQVDTDQLKALAHQTITTSDATIKELPLSQQTHQGGLLLTSGLNPVWVGAMAQFNTTVLVPIAGPTTVLSEELWNSIGEKFSTYESWTNAQPSTRVGGIEEALLRETFASDSCSRLKQLVAADLQVKAQVDALKSIEDLVMLNQYLHPFLLNFVSFRDFYTRQGKAIFQAGTLFLDGRSCDLCVVVPDIDTHAKLAGLSDLYIAYCRCTRLASSEVRFIAAAFTAGDAINLIVGRNGVFYDREGQDWDATIVKIIEKPISLREAFWLPYRRIARFIGDQIEKFASGRDKTVEVTTAGHVTEIASSAATPQSKATPPPFDVGRFAGIFAAIGLALGAIGTAIATMVGSFMALPLWEMPVAIVGIAIALSGPSVLLAWLKLRKRNLGPLLDACGWAINTRAQLNLSLGQTLTAVASVPPRALKEMVDPFAEKRISKWWYVLVLLIIGGVVAAYFCPVTRTWLHR